MNLADILDELERDPGEPRWLRALGGALGVELSRRRLETLAPVLRALARAPGGASFAAGYQAALQDVTLAFQAEVGAEVEEADVARLAQASPYAEALAALAAGNQTVTAIGVAMGKTKSSASRALAVLREAGLVVVHGGPGATSGVGVDERARPHALTARGRRVVEQLVAQRARAARRRGTPVRGSRVASAFVGSQKKR